MENGYTLALVGFADAEAATFESFFRLASRRTPAYVVQDEVMDAQAMIVNADNADALDLVRDADLPAKVLLVGRSDGGTGWPLQRKPVKLVAVLNALDTLLGVQRGTAPAHGGADAVQPAAQAARPAFAPTQPFSRSQFEALNDSMRPAGRPTQLTFPMLTQRADLDEGPRRDFAMTVPMSVQELPGMGGFAKPTPPASQAPAEDMMSFDGFMGMSGSPARSSAQQAVPVVRRGQEPRSGRPTIRPSSDGPLRRGDVLLVCESLVEGRILHQRLGRYGLRADWSREGSQALVMLKAHPYRLVVVERVTGQPDAFALCRSAKTRRPDGAASPVVFLMTASTSGMERIKAGLAGCDSFLSRSVNEADFYKALAQHGIVEEQGFETTGGSI